MRMYSISDEVYKFYIEDTKRGKNASKECVERKLVAMSLVAPVVVDNGVGCKRYQFGTFNFLVREDVDEVGMVFWSQKPCYVPEENSKRLREIYKLIGLSEDGQSIIAPIDNKALEDYCTNNNLSNEGTYRNFFFEMFEDIISEMSLSE